MNPAGEAPFLDFLRAGIERGGFATDDVLAAALPLWRQVLAVHREGRVAPLEGLHDLRLDAPGRLSFDAAQAKPPRGNLARAESLQEVASPAVEVVAESRRTADTDLATLHIANLAIGKPGEEIRRLVYLPGYGNWEHAIGHHDELTDIFSLGLILASLACGLDLTEPADLETFVNSRENLFALNPRLNPVLASVIVQMTELNRHRRAQDLGALLGRLEHYREQPDDFDFNRIRGFQEAGLGGRRKLIQAHLRDRLFEISRRNRLIYFKPTLQTLNLTIASVPLVLDYRNIRREQLFVWHPALAAAIADGAPLALGKYLRFEDAPYLPGVLDKIISEARRDRAEYGFAQLRLVLCFLRWHNLKEEPDERIHSPLLLLPVELSRKKGVRDNYVLDPTTSEAEINPVLRHHLKDLYNLNLPEAVDLRETTLDQFYETLKSQIQASEPAVVLNKLDRPQIELIGERARRRVDEYQRRLKIRARPAPTPIPADYSYERGQLRPLGLQLFLQWVRPAPLPLRAAAGAPPEPRAPGMVATDSAAPTEPIVETERQMFSVREGDDRNPYSWDFDLCNLTLGNFNYRKMTLVRDYANLMETDLASGAFDTIFSLAPKSPADAAPPTLELADQHLIIPCDATQGSAIARARTGRSYIIQGPPGTGKSQTITNLIADYVARGLRVLFVCEKRAAIDIVFHRLRQQGLDELCCLIHDSQTDKKTFILNLKETYENFLGQSEAGDPEQIRAATLRAMERELAQLRRFSEAMRQTHEQVGVPLRSLLGRLVELGAKPPPPALDEQVPDYCLWLRHGELIGRLAATLTELGEEPCLAKQPARWLSKTMIEADRPWEALSAGLDKAESRLDALESALELSGLPAELWDTFTEIETILAFASRIRTLAEKDLITLLDPESGKTRDFAVLAAELTTAARDYAKAREKTAAWTDRLSPEETGNALALARRLEGTLGRFFNPAFWRLRKALRARYDFSRHTVAPSRVKILAELDAEHRRRAAYDEIRDKARRAWGADDPEAFQETVVQLRGLDLLAHPSVEALVSRLLDAPEASAAKGGRQLVLNLAQLQPSFDQLDATLGQLLVEHKRFDWPQLGETLSALREQAGLLAELLPVLAELAELPEDFSRALRHLPLQLVEFEAAMAGRSLRGVYRQDRALSRCDGPTIEGRMRRLDRHYRDWLAQNAASIRARVRRKFLEHVNLSALPVSQLDDAQRQFKKNYAAGRRDLEHEFGKTMRYKSIRDLAANHTGQVLRDLKPVWLMSPLSVSDTLPLDPGLFDVVIFDEASQIPVEEAIPALYRSHQVIVVGDEMQLPPTSFFSATRSDAESVMVEEDGERIEVDLDADSFLALATANLPSTLLAWHYRSRFESLISFSNAAYYGGNLFTVPDRQRAGDATRNEGDPGGDSEARGAALLLARSISFHYREDGVYEQRRNPAEAAYIAGMVRELLGRDTGLSLGIVAFSEAQQTEIEEALRHLADEDADFGARLEAEYVREENDQFCGLFIKNLENVQGDERDIIILSICYGYDANRRMLMNFGPINQRGGEKRLNVIFSRSKHHMAVVSSIRHRDITNDYNDGANSLKNFLQYAEAVSQRDEPAARRVLENLNPLARKAPAPAPPRDAVVEGLAQALRARAYQVETQVGQSKFRCDLAVRETASTLYQLGIRVDTDAHYANPNLLDRYLFQPSILRACGWQFSLVLAKDWYHDRETVLNRLERILKGVSVPEDAAETSEDDAAPADAPSPDLVQPLPKPETARPSRRSGGEQRALEPSPTAPEKTPSALAAPRYFEHRAGNTRKFWEISLAGASLTVRFGRIGAQGQTQSKSFPDESAARREMDQLIAEKLKKGYREKTT